MQNKKTLRTIALTLIMSVMLSVAASASILGDYLTGYETDGGTGITLARGIYWTGSDYRNENYIDYTPNALTQPMVVYGSKVTNYGSFDAMAALLESRGYHVIAGINGDYYNMTTYDPLGLLIYEGRLMSSDSGMNAVGFKADGTAVIGRPYMTMKLTLPTGEFALGRVNKVRTGSDFSLLTGDYAPNTKSAGAGYDVICSASAEYLSMNGTYTLTVEEIRETTGATVIPEGKMILTLAATAPEDKLNAVKALVAGDTISLSIASGAAWNDVSFAVGAYRKLVTDGKVSAENSLDNTLEPRSAVGIRADGSMVLYTVDGRRSGYSVGATMGQVAERLIELGCVEAAIMDGGGSTSMNAIYLGRDSISQINTPSGSSQRSVTNYIVIATRAPATGTASQLALYPLSTTILSGATRSFSAAAADINGYAAAVPGSVSYSVTGNIGTIDRNGLFTASGSGSGTITVTAPGLSSAGVPVTVVATPGSITVRDEDGAITSLRTPVGSTVELSASAMTNHVNLLCEDTNFKWAVTGNIGAVDADGTLVTTEQPGEGTITVTAGEKTVSIPVTVYNTGAFSDVFITDWYFEAAEKAYEAQIMSGTGEGKFSPEAEVNRAMIAAILHRMAGSPAPQAAAAFTDVPAGQWYTDAVAWAQENNLVAGYDDGTFRPLASITREEMAAMLYRYECFKRGAPVITATLAAFTDADAVAAWAAEGLTWCVEKGIISGMSATTLSPKSTATRAQCAVITTKYMGL